MNVLVIKDPTEYLKASFPGKVFKLTRSSCIEDGKVPAYIIRERNGCAVNAAACLIASCGQVESFGQAHDSCIRIAKSGYSRLRNGQTDYYIRLGYEAPFIRKCLADLAPGRGAASSLFIKNRAIREISLGRPVLLNIGLSRQYKDHTITAYGYEEYKDAGGRKRLFFKVRDGYTTETRYLEYRRILGIFITYMI